MKSIMALLVEHDALMQRRLAIRGLFAELPVSVTIGGSYALRYRAEEFANREFHDYDFIVRGEEDAISRCLDRLKALSALGVARHPGNLQGSDSGSWSLGEYDGHPIDIILLVDKPTCLSIESLENVAKAKLWYCSKYRKAGLNYRQKDVDDLNILRTILGDSDPEIHWAW